MERPEDVTENGEYTEPYSFESDREATLFYSYIEQIKYIKHLDQQVRVAVEKALQIASEEVFMKYHCGHTKQNKPTKYHQVGADNLQIDKQSILSLTDKVLSELNK